MVLPCWFRRRSRGWARNGRAVKALPYGAAHETQKSKFAKRTWNVPWNQPINFLVRPTNPVAEGSHTSQKARCMRHPRLVLAARAHPTVGNEAGMCPGINRFRKCAPIADWCVGEYLYGAPVLVTAALRWLGPEREGRKGPPLRRCG